MKKLLAILGIAVSSQAYASVMNTDGYVAIKEIKAWNSQMDVHLVDNQEHQCSGGHKTRFLVDASESHKVSFLLTAFASGKLVSLSYECRSDGYPQVIGVRMR